MNVTGKMFWVPGVLIALLMLTGGCSKKSVQGSAGVGAGDGSGLEMQAEAGSGDDMSPGSPGLGEEDLEGGERSSSTGRDASTSSPRLSDQADEGETGSSRMSASQGGPSGSAAGDPSSKGLQKELQGSPGVRSRGSGAGAGSGSGSGSGAGSGSGEEGTQLARKDGESDQSPARTLGPAGQLPGDRMGASGGASEHGGGMKSPGVSEGSEGPGMGRGSEFPGEEGASSDMAGGVPPGFGSKEARGSGGQTGSGNAGAGSMESEGGDHPSNRFSQAGRGDGSDDPTSAGPGTGEGGRGSDDMAMGGKMSPSGSGSGEEEVSEPMIVAKAPPPGDAARQRLDDMKRERMESALSGVQDVYFDFDSWRLREEDRQVLEANAAWLKAHPQVSLTIEGHADPRGTQAYNLTLGEKRAESVRRYLAELGIEPDRMKIVSYGKERLFCREQHERCYQMNRRGHLVVETP